VVKHTKVDLEDMYQHYKAQLKYMDRLRLEGKTGWLDIVAWD